MTITDIIYFAAGIPRRLIRRQEVSDDSFVSVDGDVTNRGCFHANPGPEAGFSLTSVVFIPSPSDSKHKCPLT